MNNKGNIARGRYENKDNRCRIGLIVNAYDVQQAAMVLGKYASIVQDNTPANYGLASQPSMSDEARDQLIHRAMYTHEGKLALAQAMPNP